MELFKLLGTIAIDNSGANNAIDDTAGKASKAEGTMSKAFKKIGTAVVAAFAVDKVVSFGKACVEAAASVKAANSQFEQTFGELQDQATAAIDKVAESSNILDTRLKGVGTSIYAFAKTTGMESADALGLMERALQVTADSAAYYDRSLEDTSESLKSFLKGNFENDAALGLSCTETTRNAAANELYGKSFKDLSESQKQLTLLKMVEDANALSGAMGQAAREGSGWENVTGNLKESWAQFQAVIGAPILEAIVPIVQNITTGISKLTETVGGFLERMGDAEIRANVFKDLLVKVFGEETTALILKLFQTVSEYAQPFFVQMQELFRVLWDYCGTIWENVGKPMWDAISYAVGLLADYFSQKMPEILAFVQNAIAGIKDTWENHLKPVFEAIGAFLNNVLKPAFEFVFETIIKPLVDNTFGFIVRLWNDTLKPVFDGICDFLTGVFTGNWEKAFQGILSIVDGILNGIANAFTSCMDFARDAVSNGIDKIKSFFNFSWSLPDLKLPHFSISGDFSLNPLSVPSFGIDWYAKAMDDPMIMDSPTAFGINSLGQLMAGGEAGSEVVSGTDTLMNMISNAVASQNRGLIEVLYKILEAIIALDENMGGNLREALDGTAFSVNSREFARLVKAVN